MFLCQQECTWSRATTTPTLREAWADPPCSGRGAEGRRDITGPLGQNANRPADESLLLTLTMTTPPDTHV